MSQGIQRATFFGCIALATLFSPAVISRPQVATAGREYAIGGVVNNEDSDSPIPAARVQLRTDVGSVAHNIVLTNANGEFYFGQFRPGEYEVVAELDGYQSARVWVDITSHNEINLTIRLRKLTVETPTGDVTSAHQLSIPEKARNAFEKGLAKADSKGDFQGAIGEFQRAIKNYPDYYESYSEIGMAYIRLKDFSSAEKALRKSIELSSAKYPPPLMLLSMLLNDQNRPADAQGVARQAIAVEPNTWRGHYELSRALFSQQHTVEAEAAASIARKLKPDNPDVYLLLSEIHRSTHNAPALLQDIDTYLKLAPQGPAAPQVRKLREQLVKYMELHPQSAAQP
jgi:tetratricopeptide (TPR) repeat protein